MRPYARTSPASQATSKRTVAAGANRPCDEVHPGKGLEQHDRGRRDARLGLERDDRDLAALVGAEQREQESDDQGNDAEATCGSGHDDDAGRTADRHDVPEPEREDGARGEVEGRAAVSY